MNFLHNTSYNIKRNFVGLTGSITKANEVVTVSEPQVTAKAAPRLGP